MRVICLLCDSLNRHFLNAYGASAYGYEPADTPNIDWFAKRAQVFDKHFSGSLPTMPTRREVWTGNYEFLWRPWGGLEPWDRELPQFLHERDILTMLITDSYHLFERGSSNFHFYFEGWEFFRGFESDPWVTEPTPMPEFKGQLRDRYARNMRRMVNEEDLPPAKTLRCVERWLQKNRDHENFFLMIDEFAPHEPFNTPDYLVEKYDPDYKGPLLFWPAYGRNLFDESELRHLRATYAAHVTLVDKYIGRVFETMTNLGMWEDTAFILMTDHGHFLGEHGYTGKPRCPTYNALVHIPFMIYVPGAKGGVHVPALTANIDVFPTILDLFGFEPETEIDGRSVLPLIRGEKRDTRPWSLYGYFGRYVSITDGKYTYLRAPAKGDTELNIYSLGWEFGKNFMANIVAAMKNRQLELGDFIKKAGMPVGRVPVPAGEFVNEFESDSGLYNLDEDAAQNNNLAGGEQERDYENLLKSALEQVDCPPEQFRRLGL
jgi:arylsulfatase A-like enzyme